MTDTSLPAKPAATPTVDDFVAGVTADGTVKLFPISQLPQQSAGVNTTYVDAGDAATLASANTHADSADLTVKSYADAGDAATLTSANAHADSGDAATLASANSHADSGDTATLNSAKAYTDTAVAGVTGGGTPQSYVDSHDASTLASAHTYADSGDAATLTSARNYANSVASNQAATSFTPTGTGAVSRALQVKIAETCISVLDYGADPTGAADSTTAFNNAIASGKKRIYIPAGTYKVTNLVINKSIELYGDGGATGATTVNITTTSTHGIVVIGESSLGGGNVIKLRGIKFHYSGTGQVALSSCGMLVQRKVYADDLFIHGFTNDGIVFAPADAAADGTGGTIGNAVFFSHWNNCYSKSNGGTGLVIRMGANANTFTNCQFSNNGAYGVHHIVDGGATYGNTIIAGQASYNYSYGYYFESGTNLTTFGLYAEFNGSTNRDNTTGYAQTPFDFFVGDNLSHSYIAIGTVFNSSLTHVRAPGSGLNDSITVMSGGDRVFGSTGSHIPHEVATFAALPTTATLADVINQCNLIRSRLQSAGVVQ